MTKKKTTTTDKPIGLKPKKRNINNIIIQQSNDHKGCHFFINNDGVIIKGLDLDKVGNHCDDHNAESIGVVLGGKSFNIPQQKALMNIMYTCFKETGKELNVERFDKFYPGSINPNLNVRSLIDKYKMNYR